VGCSWVVEGSFGWSSKRKGCRGTPHHELVGGVIYFVGPRVAVLVGRRPRLRRGERCGADEVGSGRWDRGERVGKWVG